MGRPLDHSAVRNGRNSPLDRAGCGALADALGESPETVIAVHALRRGLCDAFVVGEPGYCRAALICRPEVPGEPDGFGEDAAALWSLLRGIDGWECVCVSQRCARVLGPLIARERRRSVRYLGDVYFTLTRPPPDVECADVRELTPADAALLDGAPHDMRALGFGSVAALLREGFAAGAIIDGQVVSICHTSARSRYYANVGVHTLEAWRRRGFAAAAATIVTRRILEAGQTPVWSAGETNVASMQAALKLGFVEVSRRAYVILE